MMWWKSLYVFLSLVLSDIYCQNYYWPNDDGRSEQQQMSFDEHRQEYSSRHHHQQHYQHQQQSNVDSTKMSEMASVRTISETYADSTAGGGGRAHADTIPIDGIVNRSKFRRTNNRRRKIGSNGSSTSSNKKSIFRRGQRHRNNKNGNVHSSRQQISLCFPFLRFSFSIRFISFFSIIRLLLFRFHSLRTFCLFVCFFFAHYTINVITNRFEKNLGNVRVRTATKLSRCRKNQKRFLSLSMQLYYIGCFVH